MTPIVILAAARTPLGSFQGSLSAVPAPRLGAAAIEGSLSRVEISGGEVTDVIMGNVLQAGLGQGSARQAALYAGLPASVRALAVNKVCGSALQAILLGAQALASGDASLIVAGGMENMSAAPYLLPKAREGYRLGHQQALDSVIHDGLWDPFDNLHMGSGAEQCARKYGFTREQQDAYAIQSFQRANAAQADGRLAQEITPVVITDDKRDTRTVDRDEGPSKVNYEKIPTLRPAFDREGTITAANASSLNDGAAAVVLATEAVAKERGRKPLARIISFGAHAQDPLWFTTAPIAAAQAALKRAGWSVADVDLWEVNEAFAVVPMAFAREMEIGPEKMNVRGGAIALGHPLGASGERIVVTLLAAMQERGVRRGVAAICIGGGEGLAVCVERL